MKIITLPEIKTAVSQLDPLPAIEAGFVAYSAGEAVVPPVGELIMSDPPGDVHIKYGYLKGGDSYVIKIASGFYENYKLDLPTSNGMMLLFDQKTGVPLATLLDEGYLTDLRTAVAGAIAAKYLAPKNVTCIGIVGTGIQGRMQLEHLKEITPCREVVVWGRTQEKVAAYVADMTGEGFRVTAVSTTSELAACCNLIVTTTPATEPLLMADAIQAGTHITAMGSDTHHKQELDAAILTKANLVVADSISQCLERGEIMQALKHDAIQTADLVELGDVIAGKATGRTSEDEITVADLTGVAVQDIQITTAVYQALA
ncbi:MAG: ornithine cyclodeaminase family protein [Chloroflexota bacterium]